MIKFEIFNRGSICKTSILPRIFFNYNSQFVVQVRFSTKKASGSKTSMKDSAGRRLGPKKYEGQFVQPGEIIFRQRGTKFYPGENTGIGKDHTIFSKELGYVRYYLDPFHPKRKFIGVALSIGSKLPTPHFSPTPRRFGRKILDNPRAYMKEENSIPRKEHLRRIELLQKQKNYTVQKETKFSTFEKHLEAISKNDNIDTYFGVQYLMRVKSYLKSGLTLNNAQFCSKRQLELNIKLQAKKETWNKTKTENALESLDEKCNFLNKRVSFDNKFRLIPYISEENKKTLKQNLINKISDIDKGPSSKDAVKKVDEMLERASKFLTLSDELYFKKLLYKLNIKLQLHPNVSKINDNTKFSKRFNYSTEQIENI